MTPSAFEERVGARFEERRYAAKLTGTHGTSGDHGIGLVATKSGETVVTQAKKFITRSVGEPVLRDLFGAMNAAEVNRAYIVTTGRVTDQARAWARGKPIEIWDAETVTGISMGEVRVATQGGEMRAAVAGVSLCPRCGAVMVERRNGRTGEPFLGCSTFLRCRHTFGDSD